MERYPWNLLQRLADHLTDARHKQANTELGRILRIIGGSRQRLFLRKLRCAQVLSFCLRGAYAGRVSSSLLLDLHVGMLENLEHAKTWRSVTQRMHRYLERLLEMVSVDERTDLDRFVQWMQQDMSDTIERPRLLHHYAGAADVSLEHLSRAFLQRTGVSFREYQKKIRLERAQKLLLKKNLKIRFVAQAVGIRSVSRFTEVFRSEIGITPAQFRRAGRARKF